MEKGKICIKFFVGPSEKNIYDYLKTIPEKHRTWEVKKVFLNSLKSTAGTTSVKEPEQSIKSATSNRLPTEF